MGSRGFRGQCVETGLFGHLSRASCDSVSIISAVFRQPEDAKMEGIVSRILGDFCWVNSQWPFQEPKLEVPTIYKIYKAYVRAM